MDGRLTQPLSWLTLALALSTCQCRAPEAPPSSRLPVEVAGCEAVREGPVCEVSGRAALTLWLPDGSARAPQLLLDGVAQGAEPQALRGGRRWTVPVEASTQELCVVDPNGRFCLPIRPRPRVELLEKARAMKGRGEVDGAQRLLEDALPSLPSAHAARARSLVARLRLSRGEVDAAVAALRAQVEQHRALGAVSEALGDARALAYALTHQRGDFAGARAVLGALGPLEAQDAEGAAAAQYYRALVEVESANPLAASAAFREAELRSERLGRTAQLANIRLAQSLHLSRLGRHREAQERLLALREDGLDACTRASLKTNLAWTRLASVPAGGTLQGRGEVVALLDQARALFTGECKDTSRESNVLVNLAFAELLAGRPADARAWLDAAGRGTARREPRLALWSLELQGRVALLERDLPRASEAFSRLGTLAELHALDDMRWRADAGKAQVALLQGREAAALVHLQDCERALTQELSRAPLQEGAQTLLADREGPAAQLVSLLMKLSRPEEALLAARRSRARLLLAAQVPARVAALAPEERARFEQGLTRYRALRRRLDAEVAEDWRLSAARLGLVRQERAQQAVAVKGALDALLSALPQPPDAGFHAPRNQELVLVFHPGSEGVWGFAQGAFGVRAHDLGAVDVRAEPARLAAQLLEPFAAELTAARRVVLMPAGALRAVELHALPFQGRPLLFSREVVYALDLGPGPAPALGDAGPQRALVMGDPGGDLPGARLEATSVAQQLRARGLDVSLRLGSAASVGTLLAQVPQVQWLHFAGHGRFDGAQGWESALRLADGDAQLSEVLTLPRAPAWVVLSGCETGKAVAEGPVETLGVGQAFLIAGSSAVLASTRPVADAGAQQLMAHLYAQATAELPGASEAELPAAARRALMKLGDAGGDWSAYRVWVR